MVDRAVTEGVTEDELRHVKKKEITVPAQESIIKAGWKPDQFRNILQKAHRETERIHSVYERDPEWRI